MFFGSPGISTPNRTSIRAAIFAQSSEELQLVGISLGYILAGREPVVRACGTKT